MGLKRYLFGWRKFGLKRQDCVLEIGSGNRPFARSDVLCDLGEYGQDLRYGGNILSSVVMDRPFVYGNAEGLPFRDNSFDCLIASHVIEHLERPDIFVKEAARVSRTGCIVAPSDIFEKIFAVPSHFWYISIIDGRLQMKAKEKGDRGICGSRFRELWHESRHLRKFLASRDDVFEVSYYYKNGIINADIEGTAVIPEKTELYNDEDKNGGSNICKRFMTYIRIALGKVIRYFASGAPVDLKNLLACPVCKGDAVFGSSSAVRCTQCGKLYPVNDKGIPVMISSEAK
jgi:uncharacterized protein YbaR (Trm112 family)/SAM-dependent methyltransferase